MNYDISFITHAVEIILAIQVIIATAELLTLHESYSDYGLFSWKVQRMGPRLKVQVKKLRLDFLCKYPNVLAVLIIRLISAIAIPLLIISNHSILLPLLLVTAISLVMQVRNSQSNDGSDQLPVICFIALLLADIIGTDLGRSIALIFIAAQASLAYGISGFLKMQKKGWYNGEYVTAVLRTSSYGDKYVHKVALKQPLLAKALGLAVIYGDAVLAFSFTFPPFICSCILIFGIGLHIGIARIMGLNTFLWSYVATYPALFYLSGMLYSFI